MPFFLNKISRVQNYISSVSETDLPVYLKKYFEPKKMKNKDKYYILDESEVMKI